MLNWVCPLARGSGALTCVLSPDDVMGEAARTWEIGLNARTREQPSRKERITLSCSRFFTEALPRCIVVHPPSLAAAPSGGLPWIAVFEWGCLPGVNVEKEE